MNELIQLEMTPDEARETDRLIKRHINTTRYLLLDMRDRKGWKALGYESFKDYGEKELGYQEAHIYRLVEAAEVSLQIGYSPIGESAPPPESQLRPLKSVPEDERKAIWYERFGQKPNNSVFNFKPTILYALAAPSTPDAIQICTAVQIYSNSVYQCRSRTALRQGTRSRAAIKAALLTRDTVGSPASRQYPRPTLNTALVTIHDFTTNLE